MRSITPRHFSLSLAYRPSHSSRGGRKIKERGLEKRRGEKSAAKRHRYIRHYACFSHACANILLVPKWLFHGERRALRSSRKRRGQRNWTRRVTAAILEKFRSRHSRSFLLWEEARGQGNGEREREGEKGKKEGEKGKWQQLSYHRKLPSSVYPATIRSCVPSTHLYLVLIVLLLLLFFSPLAFTSLFPSFFPFFLPPSSLFFLIGFPDLLTPCRLRVSAGFLQECGNRERDFCPDQRPTPIARVRPLGLLGIFPRFSYYELRDNEGCGISSRLIDVENCARIA